MTTSKKILHAITPLKQMSPFDVNMAYDAGFDNVAIYTDVQTDQIRALVQDSIFSRSPEDGKKTGIFIAGRDMHQSLEMLDIAKAAMLPPYANSVFADPAGSFTTSAAMVAVTERALAKAGHGNFKGKRVVIFGAMGIVGGAAGVICAKEGATVVLVGHRDKASVEKRAQEFKDRYGVECESADGTTEELRRSLLADAEVVFCAARAGVRVLTQEDYKHAPKLLAIADVNAVPPLGAEGVELMDDGKLIAGTKILGIGALAVGDIKSLCQRDLLRQMYTAPEQVYLDFTHAYASARRLAGLK